MCTKKCTKLLWVQRNSMAADVKPMPGASSHLWADTEYGNFRNYNPPIQTTPVLISRRRRGDYKPIYTADSGRLFINANN